MEWKRSLTPINYPEALLQMEERVATIYEGKAPELVWLLEHSSLYTAGTSAHAEDLLAPERFPVFQTGRGGQYTYHGPGQRIAYVMLNLKKRAFPKQPDIRKYVFLLEQWLINTLSELGIKGLRREGRVGIWVETGPHSEAKIAALGIRVRKWVTYHGIALNVSPELEHFKGIVPCGIREYGVTSLKALGVTVSMEEVDALLMRHFERIFIAGA